MRVLALAGLLLCQEPDVDSLLKQLTDDSIEVRDKAIATLIELNLKAEEGVKKLLATAEGELKARCEAILRAMKSNRKLYESLPPLRLVSIDAKEAKLREVLEELQRQSGLVMRVEGLADAAITVQVKDATPLQALDAVCKAADLGYYVDRAFNEMIGAKRPPGGAFEVEKAEPTIRFQGGGYVDAPRAFVRHYVLAPTALSISKWTDFKAAQSSVILQLRASWTPETKPESALIEVASVTDDKGRSLYAAPKGAAPDALVSRGGGIHRSQANQSVQLAMPEGDAKFIASVRGSARFTYLKEEKTVVFDKPQGRLGTKEEYDGLTVELRNLQEEAAGTVRLSLLIGGQRLNPSGDMGALINYVHSRLFRVKLEDGSFAGLTETRHNRKDAVTAIDLTFRNATSKVASVEVVLEAVYHHDSFDFELKNLPLPK
jgi:hypothetical protein